MSDLCVTHISGKRHSGTLIHLFFWHKSSSTLRISKINSKIQGSAAHQLMEWAFRRRRFSNVFKECAFADDNSPTFSKKVLSATAIHQSFQRKCFRWRRFVNLFKESTFTDDDSSIFSKKELSATAIHQSFQRKCFRWRRFVNLFKERFRRWRLLCQYFKMYYL